MILAIDLGTTSWKAALFHRDGQLCHLSRIPTPVIQEEGEPCYDSGAVLAHLTLLLEQLPEDGRAHVSLVALTGMAEAGLLVDRDSLRPLSNIWPWFDRRAVPTFRRLREDVRFRDRHGVTGLPDSYKYGIYKLLTLLERGTYDRDRILWMGLCAYACSLLCQSRTEDVSMAARTACVDIRSGRWDSGFLASLGLSEACFPELIAQGAIAGYLTRPICGLRAGTPVCLSGHDHVCAAYAAGALQAHGIFLSTGTAQVVLTASRDIRPGTGLSFGPCPTEAPYTCLGSIQSAGGSINYWKRLLFPGEDFAALLREAEEAPSPSGLLYYPYLAGSGAPHLNPAASGTLMGLRDSTSRGAIIAGVYEGLAMETRYLTETMGVAPDARLYCMGGLTRHPRYLRTLSDVLGMTVAVPSLDEGTLYGAARLASARAGLTELPALQADTVLTPNAAAHKTWTDFYRRRYLPMMNQTNMEE